MNNGVPIIVQQIAESMMDKSNPEHVRFNHEQTLQSISEYCTKMLNKRKKPFKK